MRILKAILGGLVGGGLGIAVVASINAFAGYNADWLGLVTGFLTGFCVRYIVRGTGKSNYVCGAVAALLTLAAIVFSDYAAATVLNVRTAHLLAPSPPAADQPKVDEDNTVDKLHVERVQTNDVNQRVKPAFPTSPGQPANRYDTVHVVWLSLAAVIAYLLGRSESPLPTQPVSDTNVAA